MLMEPFLLSKQQARRYLLIHQGLWPANGLAGKPGVVEFIRRVGCIQYDPLNIVGRNPELVLQARIGRFHPRLLDQLLYQDRLLLDGWDKNMSIYPTADWPYFQRRRRAFFQRRGGSRDAVDLILPQVRRTLAERGPLSSLDLDFNQSVDWSWAPTRLARAALESMYFWGELIIHHKINTRRVYDFAHKHLPSGLFDAPDPSDSEAAYADWYVHRRLGSIGLLWNRSSDAWLGVPFKVKARQAALARLLAQGEITEVRVTGIDIPLYMRSQDLPCLETAIKSGRTTPKAAIIAPLDNLMWDRKLLRTLFDFDYLWEVYKPVDQRRYGYYVLPILYGERFVARFDPGRDKETGDLIIKNWWWEDGVRHSAKMRSQLRRCFRRFLAYLDADAIQIDPTLAAEKDIAWLTA